MRIVLFNSCTCWVFSPQYRTVLEFASCAERLLSLLFARWLEVQDDLPLFERIVSTPTDGHLSGIFLVHRAKDTTGNIQKYNAQCTNTCIHTLNDINFNTHFHGQNTLSLDFIWILDVASHQT
jgi:hypothetical protein